MRSAFEKALGRALPVRGVHLRDPANRWSHWSAPGEPKSGGGPGTKSIVVEVPGSEPGGPGVLETTLDVPTALSDWDFQILGLAAGIGALVLEVERLRSQLSRAGLLTTGRTRRDGAAPLIGSTPVMQALRATIERVAATDFTVLLEGESGVGKELVARQIHDLSRRRGGPFVAINCAALVETLLEAELFGIEERTATGVRGRRGKFEAADGGTLFLDEVSDLSMSAQAKLLRTIQDLAIERVGSNGTHRVDIRVPTLRERKADVVELAEYFLARHRVTRPLRLTPVVADALLAYDWPGNVRELERVMERVVTLAESDAIQLDDLPPAVRGWHATAIAPSLVRNDSLRVWVRRYVRLMVDQCGGNRRKAARVLGISYHTLKSHLREWPGASGEMWGTKQGSTGCEVTRSSHVEEESHA